MGRRHDMRRRKHPRGHRRHTFGPHWGGWVGRPIPYLVTGPVIDPRDGAEALRILHGISEGISIPVTKGMHWQPIHHSPANHARHRHHQEATT